MLPEDRRLPVSFEDVDSKSERNPVRNKKPGRRTPCGKDGTGGMDAGGNTGKGSASDSEPSVGGERIYDDSGNLDRGASCRILLHPHHVVGKTTTWRIC